jgi:hypothetical protein
VAALRSPDRDASDAAGWWRAYQLAEHDQADELRKLAVAGDDHARRQLASWLSDRAFPGAGPDPAVLGEAIELIRPLADAGDDVAELWLARWLADCDRLAELRERVEAADPRTQQLIFDVIGGSPAGPNSLRVLADLGHRASGRFLVRSLARAGDVDELRQRAENGDEYAQYWLGEITGRS